MAAPMARLKVCGSTLGKQPDPRQSDSPILFESISDSYLRAFTVIWDNAFAPLHPFHHDFSLPLHSVSHLLGVAIETSIKGLLVCRDKEVPKTHNLEKLMGLLGDSLIEAKIASKLCTLEVPQKLLDANPDKSRVELESQYRQHKFHVFTINLLYDRPFATRYPVLDNHSVPNSTALREIAQVLQSQLRIEMRNWSRNTPK